MGWFKKEVDKFKLEDLRRHWEFQLKEEQDLLQWEKEYIKEIESELKKEGRYNGVVSE